MQALDDNDEGTGSVSPVPTAESEACTGANGGFSVHGWGVDTVAFALRTKCGLALVALEHAQRVRKVFHPDVPGGHLDLTIYKSENWMAHCDYARVFGYPSLGLMKVECRQSALLQKNDGTQELASPSSLVAGGQAATALVAKLLGISKLDAEVKVQRLDLTADLRFKEPASGQEFLWAMSFLKLPRYNEVPHRTKDPRVMEGVEWKTESNHTHARIYDKGLQRKQKKLKGGEEPGKLIRVERQMTFPKAKQPKPKELAKANLRKHFLGGFQPFIDAHADLAVCGQVAALAAVHAARDANVLTYQAATRLAGGLLTGQVYGPDGFHSPDARQRFDRELRALGIRFERSLLPMMRVEIGPPLNLNPPI